MAVVGAGRGGGDNINYLVKMITENKVFHFLLRNCLPLTVFYFYFPWFGNFSFSVCVCLSLPLSLSLSLSYET